MGIFGNLFGSSSVNHLEWKELTSSEEVDQLSEESQNKTCIIFKHSTRCSISSAALNRFETGWNEENEQEIYFLDLIKNREVSNYIAEKFQVTHQSPQVLVIKNEEAIYHCSHNAIHPKTIAEK